MEFFGQCVHFDPPTERAIDDLFRFRVERSGQVRKQGLVGVLTVEVLDGVTDGLHGAAQPPRNAPADLGERAAADARQPLGPPQHVFALGVRHLGKPAAALHAVGLRRQEVVHHRLLEAELALALAEDDLPLQAELAPAPDGFRRNIQPLADVVQRDHRVVEQADHFPQVAGQVAAVEQQVRLGVGPIARDAETDELVRIAFAGLDLAEEPAGLVGLLQPPGGRREPHLLIRQLSQGRMLEAIHSHTPFGPWFAGSWTG